MEVILGKDGTVEVDGESKGASIVQALITKHKLRGSIKQRSNENITYFLEDSNVELKISNIPDVFKGKEMHIVVFTLRDSLLKMIDVDNSIYPKKFKVNLAAGEYTQLREEKPEKSPEPTATVRFRPGSPG